MNVRPIKGHVGNLELLNNLFRESREDMEGQCDYARLAVEAMKTRLHQIEDKLHTVKYAIRNANRDYCAANAEARKRDLRVLKRLQSDFQFDLAAQLSALEQAKTRYRNIRTILFMYKSAEMLINGASK